MSRGDDNPRPISDGVKYFITDPLGRRQCRQIENHDGNQEGGLTVVAGPSGVLGKVRAAGGYTVSLTIRHARNVRDEVAWDVLRDFDIDIVFEIQYRGGQRRIYRECGVSTVGDSADNAGNVTFKVDLVAEIREIIETADL